MSCSCALFGLSVDLSRTPLPNLLITYGQLITDCSVREEAVLTSTSRDRSLRPVTLCLAFAIYYSALGACARWPRARRSTVEMNSAAEVSPSTALCRYSNWPATLWAARCLPSRDSHREARKLERVNGFEPIPSAWKAESYPSRTPA